MTEQFGLAPGKPKADPDADLVVGGRYKLPHPETGALGSWTRVTNVAKVLDDTYTLMQWGERMVAKGIALREDLYAQAASLSLDPADRKELQEVAEAAKEAAGATAGRRQGSALHRFGEDIDRGKLAVADVPTLWRADLQAYQRALAENGITILPEYIERTGFCAELECVGTFDRAGLTADRRLIILDKKSADKIEYAWLNIAIQLAIYSRMRHVWNRATKRWEELPPLDLSEALVIHLRAQSGECTLESVDIDFGWQCAQLAAQVGEARKRAKRKTGDAVARRYVPPLAYRVANAPTVQALSMLWDFNQNIWTPELTELGRQRLADLSTR